MEKIEEDYNNKVKELKQSNLDDEEMKYELLKAAREKEEAEKEENLRNLEAIDKTRNEQHKLLDDENYQNQLVGFLNIEGLYETYTGKTGEHSAEIVSSFFTPMQTMPQDAKDKFKETIGGAIEGLNEMGNTLYYKAQELAGGFINTFKNMFDIHSPSRVFRKIFKQTIEGGELGAEDEAKKLYKTGDEISATFTKRMQAGVSADGLISKMRSAVSAGKAFVASKLTATVLHDINLNDEQNNKKFILKGDIINHIDIDGRETAVILTPYISEELAWEDR